MGFIYSILIYQFMGDTVNAMRDYQAAIRLEPDYSLAYYNAANLYFKQRQFQQVGTNCISVKI